MKDRESKERVISFGCTPGLLRDIEELAEPQGGAQGCDGPPIEAKPGYVRCELAFSTRSYQLLQHPDAPALRVLAIGTDDGPVALLMNKEIAETVGQALLRIADQMLEKDDLS